MCLLIHEDDCSYIIKGASKCRQRGNRIVTEKYEAKWLSPLGHPTWIREISVCGVARSWEFIMAVNHTDGVI